MKYPIRFFLLFLLPFILSGAVNAQTLIKIPFKQTQPFVVQPEIIYKSLENNPTIELGLETLIHGGSGSYTFTWTKDGVQVGTDATLVVSQKGSYKLSVDDGQGCASTVTYYIDTNVGVVIGNEPVVLVFPNPAKDIFYVKSSGIRGLSRIEVFSMNGILKISDPVAQSNSDQITIDASALPAGNYLVVLHFPNEKISKVLAIR